VALAGWLLLVTFPCAADVRHPGQGAGQQPFDLTADTVEYDKARDLYTARGNVHISQPGRTLTADWVTLNNTTRLGVASGNVVVVEGQDTLTTDFLQFNIDTMHGVVFSGKLDSESSRFRMQGEEVQKVGDTNYVFRNGAFTTCRCPEAEVRAPWRIRAEHADVDTDSYAVARNSTFDVLGVPVLWFPWMIYPLNRERHTGFLFPTWRQSSIDGTSIALPFFWAVADNVNLLFTAEYLTKRGFKPSVDSVYVFGDESAGRLHASFIDDTSITPNTPSTPFSKYRWAVSWQHDHFFEDGWRLKIDFNQVSDSQYPFDFYDEARWRNEEFLESRAFLTRSFGPSGLATLTSSLWTAQDLQNPQNLSRTPYMMQRLPDVNLELRSTPLTESSHLVGTLGAEYTYFRGWNLADKILGTDRLVPNKSFIDSGVSGVPDSHEINSLGQQGVDDPYQDNFPTNGGGTEGDGIFEEGELQTDQGHRIFLTPRLSYPIRLANVLEFYPELGYRTMAYDAQRAGALGIGMFTGRFDLRTRLMRRFDAPVPGGSVLHIVEPDIGWALVQSADQSAAPLFVPPTATPQVRLRQFDLDLVTLDPADRVPRANQITVGLNNRFYSRGSDTAAGRMLADLRFSVLYDIANRHPGDFYLEGTFFPIPYFSTRTIFGYNLDKAQIDEGLLELSYSTPLGTDFSIAYRYLRQIPLFFEGFPIGSPIASSFNPSFNSVNQVGFNTRLPLTRSWAVFYNIAYSFEEALLLGNRGGAEYISKCRCWAIRVEIDQSRTRGVTYSFNYTLLGLGQDNVRPFQPRSVESTTGSLDSTRPF
jgi:lipopolysaccharide assembly outer membrane protein LptD (OstA)